MIRLMLIPAVIFIFIFFILSFISFDDTKVTGKVYEKEIVNTVNELKVQEIYRFTFVYGNVNFRTYDVSETLYNQLIVGQSIEMTIETGQEKKDITFYILSSLLLIIEFFIFIGYEKKKE